VARACRFCCFAVLLVAALAGCGGGGADEPHVLVFGDSVRFAPESLQSLTLSPDDLPPGVRDIGGGPIADPAAGGTRIVGYFQRYEVSTQVTGAPVFIQSRAGPASTPREAATILLGVSAGRPALTPKRVRALLNTSWRVGHARIEAERIDLGTLGRGSQGIKATIRTRTGDVDVFMVGFRSDHLLGAVWVTAPADTVRERDVVALSRRAMRQLEGEVHPSSNAPSGQLAS
jgi:hypothetical protein